MFSRNEPLGLPVGSVRAILVLLLVAGVLLLSFLKFPIPEPLSMGFGIAIGFYFRGRESTNPKDLPEQKEVQ